VQAFVQLVQSRLHDGRKVPLSKVANLEANPRARAWAADAHARLVALVRDLRAGTLAPWLTLDDIRARARLVDVFALLADGHRDAAEHLRRSMPRPTSPLPSWRIATPGGSVDPSDNLRPRGEPVRARREAITYSNHNDNQKDRIP
jgi:hypothetical protein